MQLEKTLKGTLVKRAITPEVPWKIDEEWLSYLKMLMWHI